MTRHTDHVPPTLDPEGDTPPAHPRRNVFDPSRSPEPGSDGVTFTAGSKSLRALGKVIAAISMVGAAGGAGWSGHYVGSSNTEAKISATQKALEEHVARADAQRAEAKQLADARDAELTKLRIDLAGHLSSIDTNMINLKGDVHDIKESLAELPYRRQPRSRPIAAPPRGDIP